VVRELVTVLQVAEEMILWDKPASSESTGSSKKNPVFYKITFFRL